MRGDRKVGGDVPVFLRNVREEGVGAALSRPEAPAAGRQPPRLLKRSPSRFYRRKWKFTYFGQR